jgi:hypothetical protein
MNSERVAGCDAGLMPRCPARSSVVASRGCGNFHTRRPQWIALPSSAGDWPVPHAAAPHQNSSSRCAAITTRAVPVIPSATGSRLTRPQHLRSVASWPLSWWAVTLMPRPEKARGRPPGRPENRPDEIAPASANREPPAGPASTRIVSQGGRKRRTARRRESLLVRASVYAPCPRRTLWAFAYVCPWCGLGHLGRARTEDEITGPRRSRCGHLVIVRVGRDYRGRAAQEVA